MRSLYQSVEHLIALQMYQEKLRQERNQTWTRLWVPVAQRELPQEEVLLRRSEILNSKR